MRRSEADRDPVAMILEQPGTERLSLSREARELGGRVRGVGVADVDGGQHVGQREQAPLVAQLPRELRGMERGRLTIEWMLEVQ